MLSSERINVTASARKLDVDNRISLRYYFRIADNVLKQVSQPPPKSLLIIVNFHFRVWYSTISEYCFWIIIQAKFELFMLCAVFFFFFCGFNFLMCERFSYFGLVGS
jgi:hypothetical protein